MAETAHQRRTVYYTGRVQGVGFRYATRSIAQQYDVVGYVQNLDDGRVLVVVEGVEEVIEKFLSHIAREMNRFIRNVDTSKSPATGQFDQFTVER